MTVKIGDWLFDSADYDAENDVLYLSIGEPRPGYGEETPEGHILRFDEEGQFCGVTLLDVKASLDEGAIDITLPRQHLPRRECLTDGDLRRILIC